jgi:hypothetical protein
MNKLILSIGAVLLIALAAVNVNIATKGNILSNLRLSRIWALSSETQEWRETAMTNMKTDKTGTVTCNGVEKTWNDCAYKKGSTCTRRACHITESAE